MSDNIGFVIGDISRLIRRTFDERAKEIGVTRPQWRVLTWLKRNEGINQGGLAELLELDAMTVCRMVDRLQESQLIERRPDPTDRRAWQLFLTPKAIAITNKLRPIGEELLQEAMDGISEAEQEQLHHLLDQVRSRFQRIDEEATDRRHIANG